MMCTIRNQTDFEVLHSFITFGVWNGSVRDVIGRCRRRRRRCKRRCRRSRSAVDEVEARSFEGCSPSHLSMYIRSQWTRGMIVNHRYRMEVPRYTKLTNDNCGNAEEVEARRKR